MDAAPDLRRTTLIVAFALFAAVFAAFVAVDAISFGIPHFFYVPVVLVAVVTRPSVGIAAGAAAAALYCLGVLVHPEIPPTEVLTVGTIIRLITFGGTGAVVGWFARDNRRLVEELRILADRDDMTGLPNTRAFEAAIQRCLDLEEPFGLLIGDMAALTEPCEGDREVVANDALVRLSDALGTLVRPDDDLARVGGREFALLTSLSSSVEAARLSSELERTLAASGLHIRFGWAVYPQEGQNALSLYRAADERLYARKLVGNPLRSSAALRAV